MKLVVIIPCYNEEKTLPLVLKSIPKRIRGIRKIQKIVVDDGSTDNTPLIAKKYHAILASHKRNMGLGAAFRTGVNKALEIGASVVVNIDGDMQFNPLGIPRLVQPILKGEADVVTATRYKDYLDYNLKGRRIKNFGNRAFTWLINRLTRRKFTDVSCGFRSYSKEALFRLTIFGHFTYTHEVFLDAIHKGLTIKEIPVKVKPKRDFGESKISRNLVSYGYSALKIIFRSFRDHRPLYFFAMPGIYIFVLGLLFDAVFVIDYIFTQQTTPFRTYGLLGGFLNIFGLILFLIGILADMIGRVREIQEEIIYQLKKSHWKRQ